MTRDIFEKHIFEKYGVMPECPWARYPENRVFRHGDNKKWFALTMTIPISKLGVDEDRAVDVVNLKLTEEVLDIALCDLGIFPAYHMNKTHWISVLLDGSVDSDIVKILLENSFRATLKK